MRTIMISLIVSLAAFQLLKAQSDSGARPGYKDFPIVVSLQFHSFSMPFKDLLSNFKNVGIGVGTEIGYGSGSRWIQHIDFIWYRNRALGNGLLLTTQAGWRPQIREEGFAEIKAGIGYHYTFRPVRSFRQVDGEWKEVGKKGTSMFTIPVGAALGVHRYTNPISYSPYVGYQFFLSQGYSKSVPLVPGSLWSTGLIVKK